MIAHLRLIDIGQSEDRILLSANDRGTVRGTVMYKRFSLAVKECGRELESAYSEEKLHVRILENAFIWRIQVMSLIRFSIFVLVDVFLF